MYLVYLSSLYIIHGKWTAVATTIHLPFGMKLIRSRLASRFSDFTFLGCQYAFFMEMAEEKSAHGKILAALKRLGWRTDPESYSLFISKYHSLEEFDVFEKKLATEAELNILVSALNNKVVTYKSCCVNIDDL